MADVAWVPGAMAPSMSGGVVILMAQTVARRAVAAEVWGRYENDDLMVIDEAHHAVAPGWEQAIHLWPGPVVGMTATPWRLSKKEGFEHLFGSLLCGLQTKELQALEPMPALCRSQVIAPVVESRILGGAVAYTGDYTEAGIAEANRERPDVMTAGAFEFWRKHASGRQTLVYAVSVEHAGNLAAVFRDAGVTVGVLLGEGSQKKAERDVVVDGFRNGKLQVLINVMVATEGFDLPSASCIVMCRPTLSLALYLQMVGRGLRPKPADSLYADCLILDLAANVVEHGLPEAARDWSLSPRGKPGEDGVAPVTICQSCGTALAAGIRSCSFCGVFFGKVCNRCGVWRAFDCWSNESHCSERHDPVCDLCHSDAHIQAHLPVLSDLGFLAEQVIGPSLSDVERHEPLAVLFRELLAEARQAAEEAAAARIDELRADVEWRELVLDDDAELEAMFDRHVAGLPEADRPGSRVESSKRYVEWESGERAALVSRRRELADLQDDGVDGRAVFREVESKVTGLLRKLAVSEGMIPDGALPASGGLGERTRPERGTVKESAVYWLSYVAEVRDGKTVGLPLADVVEKVRAENPGRVANPGVISSHASRIRGGFASHKDGKLPDLRG